MASKTVSAGAVGTSDVVAPLTPQGLWPPWGSLLVTVMLLVMASVSIVISQSETMAGAVIGYAAAFWLPPERREHHG